MELHLMRPEWLWALVPALLLSVLLWHERSRRGNWRTVISPDLLPYLVGDNAGDKARNLLPLIILGWAVAVLAATGPSWQKIPQPIHQKQDALVILLDLSYSMKSTDLAPSRIDRARQKILDLLALRREGQTGLVAYAGDAHVVTPLTDDTDTIANLMPALNPDMMPVPGSALSNAVEEGIRLLRSAGIRRGRILLVTDGVSERELERAAALVREAGVQLSVMGVGSTTGAPIPLPRGGFLKDRDGAIVMPGLEDAALNRLANDTNGRYQRMQINNTDFDLLLRDSGLPEEATIALDRSADTWDDQGYLLLPPLLLFVLCLFRRGWLVTVLPLLFLLPPERAVAFEWNDLWLTPDQQGQRALSAGNPERAAQLFEDPDWAGTAAYEAGEYEAAAEHFNGETQDADDLYNKGNALARAGKLDEAMDAYRASLERKPDQQDALDNLALLEQLKQQQEQQQQDQGQQGEDSPQDQEQQQGQDQQQQGDSQGQSQDGEQQQGQEDQAEQDGQQQQGEQQQEQGQSSPQQDSDYEQQQAENGANEEQPGEEEQTADAAEQENPGEDTGQQAQAAMQAAQESGDQERDQAMEQWLRRVPDDPSGLLREKFRYESERRAAQGEQRNDEQYW